MHQYPLPHPDELFAKLNGGQKFSKIDLKAYAQIPFDEKSSKLIVINTHKGLFRYHRMPFGVASGPSIFQQFIEGLLQGCEGVAIYLDDIIVTGSNDEDHLKNVENVLKRLEEAGVTVKQEKCSFMADSIEFSVLLLIKTAAIFQAIKQKLLWKCHILLM